MFFPAHLAAGLIIGKLTGEYMPALLGSLGPDLDHVISYIRSGLLFRPKELLKTLIRTEDPAGDQRNVLHNIASWIAVTIFAYVVDSTTGWIASMAYGLHLILDILDDADFYPLYPSMRIKWQGPIRYFSREEMVLTGAMFAVFFII
jgi:membrane-bound metal-dependent hydrolase YbcI (DUF457 family)